MQSHKKPSSFEFLRTPNFQDRSINSTFLRLCVIWTEFKRAAYWSKLRDRTKQSVKGNLSKYRKNNCNFWQVRYFKWRRFLSSTLFFFTVNWTQTAGFVTALIPLSSLYGISCRFEFHNLWRAWNRQHWLFIIWHFSLFTVMMELQFLHGVSL